MQLVLFCYTLNERAGFFFANPATAEKENLLQIVPSGQREIFRNIRVRSQPATGARAGWRCFSYPVPRQFDPATNPKLLPGSTKIRRPGKSLKRKA